MFALLMSYFSRDFFRGKKHQVAACPGPDKVETGVLGDRLEPGAELGSVAGERAMQRIQHCLTAGWGPDPKPQPLVDLVDLEREEGTALGLLDHECSDVLRGRGRERKGEGQAIPSKSQNLRDKGIQLIDPLLEPSRVDGASEGDRFHGVLLGFGSWYGRT
jgi:hypothetical protein